MKKDKKVMIGMTEKRFKHTQNGLGMQFISYDDKHVLMGTFADAKGVDHIVNLLNSLSEENEQLKNGVHSSYYEHKRIVNSYCDKIKELEKENEQLKDALKELKAIGDYQEHRIKGLDDENEQLKQFKQAVGDVLIDWSQKNLTAKQLQVVIAIMEELNINGDVE